MVGKLELYTALKRMHELTEAGAPFSLEFYKSNGELRRVDKAILRKGYRRDQTDKAQFLVAYTDVQTGKQRQFHRSLLMKLNDIEIKR